LIRSQQLQEEQQRMQHDNRLTKLIQDRDAVGIVQENQSYAQQQEIDRKKNIDAINQAKQNTATQLRDAEISFRDQEAQRLAQYQLQQKNQAQQEADQLKKQAAAYAKQELQIATQRDKQLKDLQTHLDDQINTYHNAFIRQIYDLNAALLGEQKMKEQAYANGLIEAQQFINSYMGILTHASGAIGTSHGGTGTPPWNPFAGRAAGGYVAPEGLPEYVLSNPVVRAAEQLMGGKLSQQAVLQMLAKGAFKNSSYTSNVTNNDNRRMRHEDINRIAAEVSQIMAGAFS
jgi:hypothetical protein